MSPKAQRIAIAEAHGAVECFVDSLNAYFKVGMFPVLKRLGCTPIKSDERKGLILSTLPDYLNDLNAMHEAEETMIRGQHDMTYRETLEQVCNVGYAAIIYATASQRAEAFLRTLNLWKDE